MCSQGVSHCSKSRRVGKGKQDGEEGSSFEVVAVAGGSASAVAPAGAAGAAELPFISQQTESLWTESVRVSQSRSALISSVVASAVVRGSASTVARVEGLHCGGG